MEEHDPVGKLRKEVEIVACDHHRATFGGPLTQQIGERFTRVQVQAHEGLVQEREPRPVRERLHEKQLTSSPERVGRDRSRRVLGETQPIELLPDGLLSLLAPEACGPREKHCIVCARERLEVARLLTCISHRYTPLRAPARGQVELPSVGNEIAR